MKVLITNCVSLNGGDTAILEAAIHTLNRAFNTEDLEITVFDSSHEVAAKLHPQLAFQQSLYGQVATGNSSFIKKLKLKWFELATHARRLNIKLPIAKSNEKALETYISADLIVSTGGTYLVEKYRLAARFYDFKIAKTAGTPYILLTQSMGPFTTGINRLSMNSVLNNATLTILRDPRSQQHALEVAPTANTEVIPDIVFALANEETLNEAILRTIPHQQHVIISVREWDGFKGIDAAEGRKRYIYAIDQLCTHLVNTYDARITFLSTCQGVPEYTFDDSKLANEITQALPAEISSHVTVNSDFHNTEEMSKLLETADIVVSTRLHLCILSLISGVPVLPIAYEFKTQGVFQQLGFSDIVQDIDTIDAYQLINTFDQLLKELPEKRQLLFTEVLRLSKEASRAAELIKTVI